jgi:hypothetical protein
MLTLPQWFIFRRLLSTMTHNGTFLYFAYGSNLSSERIRVSNPSAVAVGAAVLENYDLDFDYHSKVSTHASFLNIFIFVADAFISPFSTQTMHIKSFNTQQHCYVSLRTLYPGGIQTRVFLFLRWMRCPLRHAARALL